MNFSNLSSRTVIIVVITAVVLIAGGLLIGTLTPSLFPVQASAESEQVDQLFRVMLVIGGAIFLLVQGLLVFSILRFRAKPQDTEDGAAIHGNTTLEIVWTAIPAVIVFILTILSWQVWNSLQTPKDDEMIIGSVGARFNWAFNYSAPLSLLPEAVDESTLEESVQADLADDGLITVTSPELHTYAGRPVALVMTPRDVIHSFWVPAFRVKQDLIPGRETTVRFTPTQPGTYPVKCAELCGANHGLMFTDVVVHEDEAAFNTWLLPLLTEIVFPPDDPVERGRRLLASAVYPCHTCHTLPALTDAAQPFVGTVGPTLAGIADRAAGPRSTATGLSPQDYLFQSIHDPWAYLAPGYGQLMPPGMIDDENVCQIWYIVAYLSTQSETGTPPFTVEIPPQCQVSAGPQAESTAEATTEATAEAAPLNEATAEATAPAEQPTDEATGEATAEATAGS